MKNDVAQYQQWIVQAAQALGVPAELALRVARQESRWRQYDERGAVLRSPSGAVGILQVMPGSSDGRDLSDPRQNIEAGMAYLSDMYVRYRSWPLAVAAYNAGPERVEGWLKGINTLPAETRQYVAAVTGWDTGAGPGPRRTGSAGDGRALLAAGLLAAAVYVIIS